MSKVKIGDREIDYEDLSDSAKYVLKSLKSVDAQVAFKKQEINILGAAKAMYALKLQELISQDTPADEPEDKWIEELGDTIKFE